MRYSAILASFILLFSGSVLAASSDAVQLDVTKPNFIQQKDTILKAVNTDVNYGEISPADRVVVDKALSNISDQFKDVQTFSTLQADVQQQVLVDQKNLNDALRQAKKDSRMICKMEPTLGSNFDKKVCRTAAQLKRENDKVRDEGSNGKPKI